MSDSLTTSWQHLIVRLQHDDAAARQELMARAYDRLRRLAGHLFHRHFPALVQRHELDSALNETWIRLTQALAASPPATAPDFFRLAAFKMRQVLLDMVERQRRLDARELRDHAHSTDAGCDPSDHSLDPAKLSLWTEFHNRVTELPDDQRSVFEMHYYLEVSQAEIAELTGLHPRKVSRLWVAATEHLADTLPALTVDTSA